MKTQTKKIIGLFARYFFVLLLGIGNLYIFYKTLKPITVFLVAKTVSLFTRTLVVENIIYITSFKIEIIDACVAGSAFFLLFLLIFSTADVSPKKRFAMIVLSSIILFFLNFLRIIFLIAIANSFYFEIIHWVLWHFVSIVFVVAIWFFVVWIFKVKTIPFYSDIKFLLNLNNKKTPKPRIKSKKKKKR